jgi:hypothetical protein
MDTNIKDYTQRLQNDKGAERDQQEQEITANNDLSLRQEDEETKSKREGGEKRERRNNWIGSSQPLRSLASAEKTLSKAFTTSKDTKSTH